MRSPDEIELMPEKSNSKVKCVFLKKSKIKRGKFCRINQGKIERYKIETVCIKSSNHEIGKYGIHINSNPKSSSAVCKKNNRIQAINLESNK